MRGAKFPAGGIKLTAGEVRQSLSSQAVVSITSSLESPEGTGGSGPIQDASDANSAPCFCERFHGPGNHGLWGQRRGCPRSHSPRPWRTWIRIRTVLPPPLQLLRRARRLGTVPKLKTKPNKKSPTSQTDSRVVPAILCRLQAGNEGPWDRGLVLPRARWALLSGFQPLHL